MYKTPYPETRAAADAYGSGEPPIPVVLPERPQFRGLSPPPVEIFHGPIVDRQASDVHSAHEPPGGRNLIHIF